MANNNSFVYNSYLLKIINENEQIILTPTKADLLFGKSAMAIPRHFSSLYLSKLLTTKATSGERMEDLILVVSKLKLSERALILERTLVHVDIRLLIFSYDVSADATEEN
jgi:hypothetical protein